MRVLITAGPTWEPIDRVRYIANRSSGKLGLSIAQAAEQGGHDVTLLLGPGVQASRGGRTCYVDRFTTTGDLQHLLQKHFPSHDVLIMAAAVAEYRPAQVLEGKHGRNHTQGRWHLELEPTPDLVAQVAAQKQPHQRVIAFALESDKSQKNLKKRAADKLEDKGVDAIVANPLETMEADDISPVWITPDHPPLAPGKMSKVAFGTWLFDRINSMFG